MKIVIADIPDEGLIIDVREKLDTKDITLVSPVATRLSLNKVGSEIVVAGSLNVEIQLQCSRCLKEFRQSLDVPVNVVYHPIGDAAKERHALRNDEMDMGFYKGEELDLQELLKEQILLNTQMKPLCSEQCRGICPTCGKDLNAGQCDCIQKETDPRLAVLKKLLKP